MGEGGISNGLGIGWLYMFGRLSWEVFVLLVSILFASRRALQQSCRQPLYAIDTWSSILQLSFISCLEIFSARKLCLSLHYRPRTPSPAVLSFTTTPS
jgi:hypothetical protein